MQPGRLGVFHGNSGWYDRSRSRPVGGPTYRPFPYDHVTPPTAVTAGSTEVRILLLTCLSVLHGNDPLLCFGNRVHGRRPCRNHFAGDDPLARCPGHPPGERPTRRGHMLPRHQAEGKRSCPLKAPPRATAAGFRRRQRYTEWHVSGRAGRRRR